MASKAAGEAGECNVINVYRVGISGQDSKACTSNGSVKGLKGVVAESRMYSA